MLYPLNTPLTELLLLSIISESDSYGYLISQNLRKVSKLNDSALYPLLKKLSDDGYVEIYDQQFQGRNRKYYRITEAGDQHRLEMRTAWEVYCGQIEQLITFEKKEAVVKTAEVQTSETQTNEEQINEGGNNND